MRQDEQLEALLRLVESGEEVAITRSGVPIARLMSLRPKLPKVPGGLKGQIIIHDNFDDPLPEEFWSVPV